ncbi:MAG: glycosyl hydrolase-related protein, partial [Verrucomicrobia bacterium]|nr:glycosyl hydrolase-related protein [Verrucomicrobiota bacterium]
YLLNNMFDVNIRWDQPGPVRFTWSLRSHAGNWQQGKADEFGWDVHNPLLARMTAGRQTGPLPTSSSFLSVNVPNVVCTTIKPAEANGRGYIVRLHETQGKETTAKVTLPFLKTISSARETDLVENDRPQSILVQNGSEFSCALRPFEVKTIRLICDPKETLKPIQGLNAVASSDMQVKLAWQPQPETSYYRVYRGDTPDFSPSLLRLVGRSAAPEWLDQPQLNYGGWINNRLEPQATYYYRVAAVDRGNNEGPASAAVPAITLDPKTKNMVPLKVEGFRAILVSPLAPFNFVNLLFRTSCESDVQTYEVHRSTQPGFQPNDTTRVGLVEAAAVIKGSGAYGHVPIDYRAGDYDHQMYEDADVQPLTTYYYRVRAIDTAGQKGPFSEQASALTGPPPPPPVKATASSIYAAEYGPSGAVDGSLDPLTGWVSRPYGGGTKEEPKDTWLEVELPRPVQLSGVVVVGDDRPVIPLQKNLRISIREGADWKTVSQIANANEKIIHCRWDQLRAVSAIRVQVMATDLPKSERSDIPDGVVRVAELMVLLPDGSEVTIPDLK